MWVGLNTSVIFQIVSTPPPQPRIRQWGVDHTLSGHSRACLAYSVYISSETLSSTLDIYFNTNDKNYLENRIHDTL